MSDLVCSVCEKSFAPACDPHEAAEATERNTGLDPRFDSPEGGWSVVCQRCIDIMEAYKRGDIQ